MDEELKEPALEDDCALNDEELVPEGGCVPKDEELASMDDCVSEDEESSLAGGESEEQF